MPVAAKMIDLYEKQAVIAGLFMIAAIFLSFSWPDEKLQKPTFPGRDPYGVRRHFFVNQLSGKRSIFDALELSFPQALKNTFRQFMKSKSLSSVLYVKNAFRQNKF